MAARPALSRREVKARQKALKVQAKAEAIAAKAGAPVLPDAEPAGPLRETDWSTPWWEDRQPTLAD